MTATGTPPGWYSDPWRQATWRWWDGIGWTAYTGPPCRRGGPASTDGPLRAGGIAILGFLVGLALSTVIGLALLHRGLQPHDPAVLLGW